MLKAILLLFFPLLSFALVEPPNYNFSLDELALFYPDKTMSEIEKKYPKSEVIFNEPPYLVKRYEVSHIRYKFPVLVQYKDGKVLDFYARLPAYFLHDIFHQSLINRYGKQDQYKKVEEQAVYGWKNAKGLKITYSGGCTITCFPIFLCVEKSTTDKSEYQSILTLMKNSRIKF